MSNKKPMARLTYCIDVTCPECQKEIDLLKNNDGRLTKPILNKHWTEIQSIYVECDHCQHEFNLSGVEY